MRVEDFLLRQVRGTGVLSSVFSELAENTESSFLFGGMVRDILSRERNEASYPRDWDIVVSRFTPRLMNLIEPHVRKQTRFGGLELLIDGQDVDIWSLDNTWAFREKYLRHAGFNELPKTTFLNVQAIAVELSPVPLKIGKIFEHGFYDAFARKVIDINLEENPFPGLCVLSALSNAARLGFSLSARLTDYILKYYSEINTDNLARYQRKHWGTVRYPSHVLDEWIHGIQMQHAKSPRRPTRLNPSPVV